MTLTQFSANEIMDSCVIPRQIDENHSIPQYVYVNIWSEWNFWNKKTQHFFVFRNYYHLFLFFLKKKRIYPWNSNNIIIIIGDTARVLLNYIESQKRRNAILSTIRKIDFCKMFWGDYRLLLWYKFQTGRRRKKRK